ncbi:hypothetical protein BBJ28_00000358 [Nothophytophthora sp. Chile5]|nr:hypothetical protein BBJ28_00000358 [Nothophytophthora sp. Chile5]
MAAPHSTRAHARGGARGVGESLILKRRQREDHLASYSSSVQGFAKVNSRAEWEYSLHQKGESKQVQRTVLQLKNQHESQLHSRRLKYDIHGIRRRLAELYNSEMDMWREACLANVETPEDRKQNESCDDSRVEDSNKIQQLVLNDRDKQLEEKTRQNEQEVRDSIFMYKMAQLWVEDRLKKEERDRQDVEMAEKRNEEMRAILDLQVGLEQKRKAEIERRKRQEELDLLDEWERLRIVEEQLEQKHREKEIARALDVKKFNQERVEATQHASERERLYDQRLLEQALAQEAETQRREAELQEKFRQDQLEYQLMLRRQMETEAEDLSYLDQIRKDMENEVWAKRDAQHNAEEAARQELLRQVLLSRTNQIEARRTNKIQLKEEDTAYMEQLKRESEEALQKELREQEERREELKRTQADVLRQQEERRLAEEQTKQADFLELKRMQLAEKKHKERVKQFSSHVPPTNHRRKTAQWYFDA